MFITFEGIEGSGKTTQIVRLAQRLTAAGHSVVRTREPGGTELANQIRALFLRPGGDPMPGESELFLVLAARASHVRELVLPSIMGGAIVLCDRFSDATLAYQGFGRGIDLDLIRQANQLATGGRVPDWTLLLDLPVEEGLNRAGRRNAEATGDDESRLDREAQAFHRRVRDGYLSLARSEPSRITIIDASGSEDDVSRRIDAEAERRRLFEGTA